MPSPFPGMNPYLEKARIWQDFHQTFLVHVRATLNRQLGPQYIATVEEHLYIHEMPEDRFQYLGRPDLSVTRTGRPAAAGPAAPAQVTLPVRGRVDPLVEIERQIYLEIRDRDFREVVTVVEMLSPANKDAGKDRDQYLAKRVKLFRSPANVVEIDLLRRGERLPVDDLAPCAYYALVSRKPERPGVDLWPVQLRDRLPVIPVPLRPGDPEPRVDLQALLQEVYDESGYEKILYDSDPEPPLPPEDDAWARSLIPSRG